MANKFYALEKNFIISLIPKNACTSIKKNLLEKRGLCIGDTEDIHKKSKKRLDLLNFNEIKNYKIPKILIIRNPYNRIYSAGSDKILNSKNFPNKGIPKYMNFSDFLEFIRKKPKKKLNNHFKPQYLFFDDMKIFDLVLKMEFLSTGNLLKNNFDLDLIQMNKSNSEEMVNKENTKIINEIYYEDFKILGYKMKE